MPDLLSVKDLVVEYKMRGKGAGKFRAVDGVTLTVGSGETVALVGESGSGKSTIGRAVLGLAPVAGGEIRFEGRNITRRTTRTQRALARELQVVFQDPYSSLNPSKTIGESLTEPLRAQGGVNREQARQRIGGLLERVGLPADASSRFPSRFSGGQRQRIAIARALALGPKLIICDEPTGALDVSTQAQVLGLFAELQAQLGLGYLFITHDLAVVRHFAHRVLVLRNGALVEQGTAEQICDRPMQFYTQQLVAAAPVPDPVLQRKRRAARLALAAIEAD